MPYALNNNKKKTDRTNCNRLLFLNCYISAWIYMHIKWMMDIYLYIRRCLCCVEFTRIWRKSYAFMLTYIYLFIFTLASKYTDISIDKLRIERKLGSILLLLLKEKRSLPVSWSKFIPLKNDQKKKENLVSFNDMLLPLLHFIHILHLFHLSTRKITSKTCITTKSRYCFTEIKR